MSIRRVDFEWHEFFPTGSVFSFSWLAMLFAFIDDLIFSSLCSSK